MDSAWMGVVWRNLCNRVGFELGPQGQWPSMLDGNVAQDGARG